MLKNLVIVTFILIAFVATDVFAKKKKRRKKIKKITFEVCCEDVKQAKLSKKYRSKLDKMHPTEICLKAYNVSGKKKKVGKKFAPKECQTPKDEAAINDENKEMIDEGI
jgi:hypothetical protein